VISLRLALQLRMRAMPAAAAVVCRSLAKHSSWVLDPHFAAMLVRDSRTSSANGAFGRHERQDSDGMRASHGGVAISIERAEVY
jgi:hypothetical protein